MNADKLILCKDSDSCSNCENKCIFSLLSGSELDILNQNLSLINYNKNETVFKQKTYVSDVLYLKEGAVKTYLEGSNGKNLIVNIIPQDNFIGLTDLYKQNTHTYSSVAIKNSSIYSFEIENFRKILHSNPAFSKALMEDYCDHAEFIYTKLGTLGTKQMHGRLADAIIYLSSEKFSGTDIFRFLTRSDIAEFTGMSKENAIRLLTEFKNDGLISLEGKSIMINNHELLRKLSAIG
ncbi:MAG TPA: Crp/Fnr family transcriptional regulator [Bacteroidales bacterium]|nr:Crp/Fnr family transcriptional regulator [Bacteroidales bacterium]